MVKCTKFDFGRGSARTSLRSPDPLAVFGRRKGKKGRERKGQGREERGRRKRKGKARERSVPVVTIFHLHP